MHGKWNDMGARTSALYIDATIFDQQVGKLVENGDAPLAHAVGEKWSQGRNALIARREMGNLYPASRSRKEASHMLPLVRPKAKMQLE